ncbi:NADH:flavin oxidoreductase [Paraliobacillus quinghaiensis]|uniref:NADH:flavin oxidoreductase n=1 Tax=Paraliobacillus quinghaiensis TaxID=470815 RepID=A0A917TND7_9BACI|nr:FAD-dependent oxidoreductase [Paraliobacillus quinghaiensis]GGM29329.1 NADH:flavin oxidoreductase [Paraliobacillus quinghaiensis]
MKYPLLFSQGSIGSVVLKNRAVMPAIGTSLAKASGEASQELIQYYEERAKGGCGLIITEITKIDEEYGAGLPTQLTATSPKYIPQLERLAKTVHKYGTKLFVQLHHPGRETHSHLIDGKQIVAPSAIMCKRTQEEPRELTTDEVEGLVKKFVKGAKLAQNAGVDGIELHGAHGYLINQFISPYTNKRVDKYGGHFENRMRFITEIILGIKHICGSEFPISVRLSADEFVDGGLKLEDTIKISRYLESIGIDALNISSGTYESGVTIVEPTSYPQGWKQHLAKGVKAAVKIPVIAVNVVRKPDFAESLLENEIVDFVGLGRAQLADPSWCNKAFKGLDDQIRPCISCLHCIEEVSAGRSIKCAVNPIVGRELEFNDLAKDGDNRVIAIIGGGPGGMEAARTLALKGYKPVIFEKEPQLGGALRLAGKPPGKEKMTWFVNYQENELRRLNVDIRVSTKPTIQDIKELEPHAVFWAAGAEGIIPPIEGINQKHISTANDILDEKVKVTNKKVVVIGSGMTGCETAEMLAANGNEVTIVEIQKNIGNGIYPSILFDITQKLNKYQVNIMTEHRITAIGEEEVTLSEVKLGSQKQIEADHVVLSIGVKPRIGLLEQLKQEFQNVIVIGDAHKSGRVSDAVREGFEQSYIL